MVKLGTNLEICFLLSGTLALPLFYQSYALIPYRSFMLIRFFVSVICMVRTG